LGTRDNETIPAAQQGTSANKELKGNGGVEGDEEKENQATINVKSYEERSTLNKWNNAAIEPNE
jgi:hypothetical protein